MFVNTLAIRSNPAGEKTVSHFLDEVKQRAVEVFDNQDYQFDELIDKLDIPRLPGQNPLFDVLFHFNAETSKSLQKEVEESGGPSLKMKPFGSGKSQVKFDFLFSGGQLDKVLFVGIQYSTELFKPETIKRFFQYFDEVVDAVIVDENMEIKDISISHDLAKAGSNVYSQKDDEFDF